MTTYGNPILAGTLANTTLADGRIYDNTVVFPKSGYITSVRKEWVGGAGYSAGTGGSVAYQLQTDDGTASHLPAGSVLGQSVSVSARSATQGSATPTVTFTDPIFVEAGEVYHLLAFNTDADPSANYVSMNDLWTGSGSDTRTIPPSASSPVRSPILPASDSAVMYKDSGGTWTYRTNYTSIVDFTYSDGAHAGQGYMEASATAAGGAAGHRVSGSEQVGEVFTVSGPSLAVSSLAVGVVRISGTSPLTATLVSDGETIATTTETGIVQQSDGGLESANQDWATFNLNATLQSGVAYQLQFSAPSDTIYMMHGIRDGAASGYGWSPATVFSDGYANYNPGTGWTQGWDTWGDRPVDKDQDLSFYFSSSSTGGSTVSSDQPDQISTDQLSLILSEDAWNGDAQFVAKVDGTQIGGPSAVTALHQSGQTQTFAYSGTWGAGPHTVEIDFVNDASGRRAAGDRNLYVEGVEYNGTAYLAGEHAMYQNGAFQVVVG